MVLKKLSEEVKSWSFVSRKGSAKYAFEDSNSATFFLSFVGELLEQLSPDLVF